MWMNVSGIVFCSLSTKNEAKDWKMFRSGVSKLRSTHVHPRSSSIKGPITNVHTRSSTSENKITRISSKS